VQILGACFPVFGLAFAELRHDLRDGFGVTFGGHIVADRDLHPAFFRPRA